MPQEPRNIVGPQVRSARYQLGLSQPELAAKCQLLGWGIARDTIAKIEGQTRWVGDEELVHLEPVLSVRIKAACGVPVGNRSFQDTDFGNSWEIGRL